VQCKDAVVLRDGSVDATGARALAERLWASWEAGGTVTFRDIDYDRTLTGYSGRLVDLREAVVKVNDGATMADGEVEVALVEV
jgi:hypothetical protein